MHKVLLGDASALRIALPPSSATRHTATLCRYKVDTESIQSCETTEAFFVALSYPTSLHVSRASRIAAPHLRRHTRDFKVF